MLNNGQNSAFASSAASSEIRAPQTNDASVVIFGASGDLTARKLMPALFMLWKDGFFPDQTPIVAVARRDSAEESFRNEMFEAVCQQARASVTKDHWRKFASRLFYRRLDLEDADGYTRLRTDLEVLEAAATTGQSAADRVVYLATAPRLFLPSVEGLSKAGMIPTREARRWLRVVFEKPFGQDLQSSQELSRCLGRLLREEQIYRIDHYLGKETVQNILLFRFGNSVFEPLLNRSHVDNIQITVAESQGIERGRGSYYDKAGALRDVLQNHLLQLLCLVAMEPPALFRDKEIRDEKLKVLQALAPGDPNDVSAWSVAGQYSAGVFDGRAAIAYRQEERVAADSRRDTYVAMRVGIDNWRWAGVPFFLRTGKRLPHRVTEIAIEFKLPPLNLFATVECDGDICSLVEAQPNMLVFRIQPQESISLSCSTKRPGMQYQIHPVTMDFEYEEEFEIALPEAYERLLLDVIRGDSTLFTRSDELHAAWNFVTPVLQAWEESGTEPHFYPAGSWGPAAAADLLTRSGHRWRVPRSI